MKKKKKRNQVWALVPKEEGNVNTFFYLIPFYQYILLIERMNSYALGYV